MFIISFVELVIPKIMNQFAQLQPINLTFTLFQFRHAPKIYTFFGEIKNIRPLTHDLIVIKILIYISTEREREGERVRAKK